MNESIYFHRERTLQSNNNVSCDSSAISLQNQETGVGTQSPNGFVDIHLEEQGQTDQENHIVQSKPLCQCLALKAIAHDFVLAYQNTHVLKWSLWWAMATCGYLQVRVEINTHVFFTENVIILYFGENVIVSYVLPVR